MFARSVNDSILKEEGLPVEVSYKKSPVLSDHYPHQNHPYRSHVSNWLHLNRSGSTEHRMDTSIPSGSNRVSGATTSASGADGKNAPSYSNEAGRQSGTHHSSHPSSSSRCSSSGGGDGGSSSMFGAIQSVSSASHDAAHPGEIPSTSSGPSSTTHAGSASTPRSSHTMTFYHRFVDPSNSRRLHPELPPKPVVDCSTPFNVLDETHQARKFGVQKLGWDFLSLNEWTGVHETVPYSDSHHTWDILKLWLITTNVLQWNYFMARGQASGGILGGGPRTRFAWNIAFFMSQLRMNLATLIGAGGYFYSYELLYTYGPACVRIRDPSPNAWRRAWDEDQSTYGARAISSIFPALGYAFYSGRMKRSAFWFMCTLTTSLYYEYARLNILPGTRLFYSYLANQQADRDAGMGSLAPKLKRRVDPDTNRTESAAQFRNFRVTTGELQNTVWENATHETLPLHHSGMKLPNPYYNWQKAPQTYDKVKIKVKNDLWEIPTVMSAKTLAGI